MVKTHKSGPAIQYRLDEVPQAFGNSGRLFCSGEFIERPDRESGGYGARVPVADSAVDHLHSGKVPNCLCARLSYLASVCIVGNGEVCATKSDDGLILMSL